MMLATQNLGLRYGPQSLFTGATLLCHSEERYGITGKNGAGKSSALRVIAGVEKASEGEIDVPQNAQIGMLKQDHFQYEDWRLLDVVVAGKADLWAAFKEKDKVLAHEDFTEADGIRLGELEETIAMNRGYEAESLAHAILSGLGLPPEKHEGKMSALSGGFKLRVLLAQVLFQEPEIMLLDEPTNHLDITSIHWLEEYLKFEYKGILIFVSHDKHFLNAVATHILDIDYDTITDYYGNYDQFMVSKMQTTLQQEHARKHQDSKVAQLQTFVDRFSAKASKAKQAKSKQKQIDKIELTEVKVSNRTAPYFHFKPQRASGKVVLEVDGISKHYGDQAVLRNVSFQLGRGEKVAIIGANGLGKSTLLKIVMGLLPADGGEYRWGYETHIGYFAQDHHEQLNEDATLLNWLTERAPPLARPRVRNYLGQMLFSGDDVHKKISQISGGEAARLLAAYWMMHDPNVLIMDEPTNHLDLESVEALAESLVKFDGTVLFVSHDRDFVRQVATRIIVLTPNGLQDITAGYDDYLDASGQDYLTRDATALAAAPVTKEKKSGGNRSNNKDKGAGKLEKQMADLEQKIALLDAQMAAPTFYTDATPEEVREVQKEREDLSKALDDCLSQWGDL
ncbi:MAG: ABC-F family ATP-binding cassette domain-containing protein [Gammaproteobacteria bacterium]